MKIFLMEIIIIVLKSTDIDGKTQLSDIITVKYNRPDSYAVFPNPAQDFMTIDLSSLNGQPVDISVVTPLGQVVKSIHLDNPLSITPN